MSGYGRDEYDQRGGGYEGQSGGGYGGGNQQQGGYGGGNQGGGYGYVPSSRRPPGSQQIPEDRTFKISERRLKLLAANKGTTMAEAANKSKVVTVGAAKTSSKAAMVAARITTIPAVNKIKDTVVGMAMDNKVEGKSFTYTPLTIQTILTSYSYGGSNDDDDDLSGAARHAEQHAGSSGDSSIFSSVLSSLGQNKQQYANQGINEQGSSILTTTRSFPHPQYPTNILKTPYNPTNNSMVTSLQEHLPAQPPWAQRPPCKRSRCSLAGNHNRATRAADKTPSSVWQWLRPASFLIHRLAKAMCKVARVRRALCSRQVRWRLRCSCSPKAEVVEVEVWAA